LDLSSLSWWGVYIYIYMMGLLRPFVGPFGRQGTRPILRRN
jgi:hypothetical protein